MLAASRSPRARASITECMDRGPGARSWERRAISCTAHSSRSSCALSQSAGILPENESDLPRTNCAERLSSNSDCWPAVQREFMFSILFVFADDGRRSLKLCLTKTGVRFEA